jgi:TRAP-type C4-dicarboxylate transport system permease small subunit
VAASATAPPQPSDDPVGRVLDVTLGYLSAIILFILMLLTVVDVLGRFLLNAPLPGGFEITELMMAALVFAAMPAVTRREDHIVIDLLDFMMPTWIVRPRQVIVNLLCVVLCALWAWRTWVLGDRLAGYGEVTEYLHLPLAPICYFIGLMSGLTGLVFLWLAWRYATGQARIKTSMNIS